MYVVLGGKGMQGQAIVHYLLNATDEEILVIDSKKGVINNNNRIKYYDCHIENILGKQLNVVAGSVVVDCLPTEYGFDVANTCAKQDLHVVNLGGVTSATREQFTLAEDLEGRGITMVPDCGLAPGIISSLAAKFIREEKKLQGIKIYCGGLPKFPELPLSYIEVFYLGGVIKEYSGIVQEIKDGITHSHPTLTDIEKVFVPSLGILEAARTSGGLSTAVDNLSIRNLSYKTLRYPGHWEYVKENILSQPKPLEILKGLVKPVSGENPDIVVLVFKLEYSNKEEEMIDYYWEYDYENGISAMAQATGYTVAAVATMIKEGSLRNGVVGMHEIDADKIIDRVRELSDQYTDLPFSFEED